MKITDALLGEHGTFYAQFARLEEELPACRHTGEVREQAALLAAALVSHARLEDELLFAQMAEAGIETGLLATMEDEHARVADGLVRAQGTSDVKRAREALLDVIALARDHFAREERFAFPAAGGLGAAALEELGATWARRREVHIA